MVKNADTVYITGNPQLYATRIKEPEKQTFVMLVRNTNGQDVTNGLVDTTNIANQLAASKTDSVKFVVYPNPFSGMLNVRFTLHKACMVRLLVSSMMDAHLVY